jgi:hypothetical protein
VYVVHVPHIVYFCTKPKYSKFICVIFCQQYLKGLGHEIDFK